jgi:type II secretory pathway pseudopilin PulG
MSIAFTREMTAKPRRARAASSGFTLLELVLATLISSLVIGIVSVALTFSLRTWERQQNRQPSDMPAMLDLMKMQLAQFDPTYIRMDGDAKPLFQGEMHSLALATAHSVKAISNGTPVVARYVYDEREKKLYYAEMPLDTYHTDGIKEFLRVKPSTHEKSWPRFFTADAPEFTLTYGGREKGSVSESWGEEDTPLPSSVLIKWASPGESASNVQLIIPNFIFPLKTDKQSAAGVNQAPLQGSGEITQ